MANGRATAAMLAGAIVSSLACDPSMVRTRSSGRALHATEEIDTDRPVYIPLSLGATVPGIATDGRIFFAAWRDWRDLTTLNDEQIYGARISASGRVLEPTDLFLATGTLQYLADDPVGVAFDGTNFVVAWADAGLVNAVRVTPSGQRLDAAPRSISVLPQFYSARWASIACSGVNCLVTWVGGLTPISAVRVDGDLNVLDAMPIRLTTSYTAQPIDQVAFDGINYVVIWEDWTSNYLESRIVGVRVRPSDGVVLDSVPVVISSTTGGAHGPHIACEGGERCLVSWQGRSGVAQLSGGVPVQVRSATITGALSWDGTSYRTAWNEPIALAESMFVARLDAAGALAAPPSALVRSQCVARVPSLAATSTTVFVAWEGSRDCGGWDALGARTGTAGNTLDAMPIPLSACANGQDSPAAAFDGTNYLWVWNDERQTIAQPYGGLYGARVSADGVVLDPVPIFLGYGIGARVAFDGLSFLVVWGEVGAYGLSNSVYAVRVSTGGAVIDPLPIQLSFSRSICTDSPNELDTSTSVVCSPSECAVLSTYDCIAQFPPRILKSEIKVIRVDPTTFAAQTSSIATNNAPVRQAAIAFDSTNYLAVWTDGANVRGSRIAPSGAVIDRAPIAIVSSTAAVGRVDLAASGAGAMLVWERAGRVLHTRLSSAAVALDGPGLPITRTSSAQQSPSITIDGTAFWIIWNDALHDPTGSDVYGASIDPTGTTTTATTAILLAAHPRGGFGPLIAHGGPGRALLTYAQYDPSSAFMSTRVHARIVSLTGSVPETDAGVPEPDASSDAAVDASASGDAASPDAMGGDALAIDGGEVDALAAGDAALEPDGGSIDGAASAGEDATSSSDAAGREPDAAHGRAETGGCSCEVTAGRPARDRSPLAVLLVGLLISARPSRRRGSAPHPSYGERATRGDRLRYRRG
jgi:hypothetical protein